MDPKVYSFSSSNHEVCLQDQPKPLLSSNQNFSYESEYKRPYTYQKFGANHIRENNPSPSSTIPSSTVTYEDDHNEDCDLSDDILRYISDVLMEEVEDYTCLNHGYLDLQAAEKSFYEVLDEKYSPYSDQNSHYSSKNFRNHISSSHNGNGYSIDQCGHKNFGDYHTSWLQNLSTNSLHYNYYELSNSPISPLQNTDLYGGDQFICQFHKGVEEANNFLPSSSDDLFVGLKGTKNHFREDSHLEEERASKMAANYPEPTVRSDDFDEVLLCNKEKGILQAYREALKNNTNKKSQQNEKLRGVKSKKGRRKKERVNKKVVDLRTLLIHCAQAVAIDDHRNASDLIKQIRENSSPFGDGNQRLAYCFADGLEARLAGTGSQIYKALVSKRTTASDYLKAYHLYLASCPFRKISNFVSNKTILDNSGNSTRIHIIDFGILYGFQWPTFIQRISAREGGPPKVRITGIEYPQLGFRPAALVEETGRRLIEYARRFNVPFEYNAVAKKWDNIELEDLKIENDDFLVVNCLYRAKTLHDDTILGSSREKFTNLVRKIDPNMFVHGIINGAYSPPFFVTRFKEALFHFSSLFDMLENNVPREDNERMLIEREIFGKEALNVIACEGWERVERPETYKQWQVRNLRAGFGQICFDREVVTRAKNKVRSAYHKDFVIDEDSKWLLQGWKGRIVYALSCWKPA